MFTPCLDNATAAVCVIYAYMDRASKSAKRIQADAGTLPLVCLPDYALAAQTLGKCAHVYMLEMLADDGMAMVWFALFRFDV